MKFGPEIKVDGIRPEWLKDDDRIGWTDHTGFTHPPESLWTADMTYGWDSKVSIRLPANHPHYTTPTPDERAVAPELVKRLVDLARSVATSPACTILQTVEAQNILAALEPVDGDLVEARKIALQFACPAEYSKGTSYRTMEGDYDNADYMKAIKAALARGRQLEKEGK